MTAEAPAGNSIIAYLLPWILILGFYYWMSRRMSGGVGGVGGMPNGLKDLLGGRFTKPSKQSKRVTFDDETAARVDDAVIALLKDADNAAVQLIDVNRRRIEQLVARLEAEETLDAEEIQVCLNPDKITKRASSKAITK